MKTHIFFDTNILEIPKNKDFSKFQFSGEYQKVIDFINEYDLQDKIEILVPKIVLEELLKHYKEDFKDKFDKVNDNIIEINKNFGSVLKSPPVFLPKYNKNEYYRFIKNSLNEYTDNLEDLIIAPYPRGITPIIRRAIDIKKPFVSRQINGKDHKDGGFKDVIIWETILKTKFEKDDEVILFSEDLDFDENVLKKEINNSFKVISNFLTLKEVIINIHDINDPFYKILKLAKSNYFIKHLVKGIRDHLKYKLEEDEINLKEVNVKRDKIQVIGAAYNEAYDLIEWDLGKGYYDEYFYEEHGNEITEDYLKILFPVEFIYEEYNTNTFFKSSHTMECYSDLVDIRAYVYSPYFLEKNREIIDYDK